MDEPEKDSPPPPISGWVTLIMLLLGGLIVLALIYTFVGGIGAGAAATAPVSSGKPSGSSTSSK